MKSQGVGSEKGYSEKGLQKTSIMTILNSLYFLIVLKDINMRYINGV